MDDDLDISAYTISRPTQLNAEDLEGGPAIFKVARVGLPGGRDQPVHVFLEGRDQPWKPCLTMRQVLQDGWGKKARYWPGRSVELYRDPNVNSPDGTRGVGGIRIKRLSHMPRTLRTQVNISRGKRVWIEIPVLDVGAPKMEDVLEAEGLTVADLDRWLRSLSPPQPTWSEHPEKHGGLLKHLMSGPDGINEIKALRPSEEQAAP